MHFNWQPPMVPALTLLVAVMLYAGLRVFQSAYVLFRSGLLHWQARKILGELQDEVDQGRRTPFELFLQHGLHHLQLREPHRARAFFEAASVAHPLSPHGYYGQGLAHRESLYFPGRLQEEALLKALERDSDHDDARRLLVEFYVQAGLYDEARAQMDRLPLDQVSTGLLDVLDRVEPPGLEVQPTTWSRVSNHEKLLLVAFDALLAGAALGAIAVPNLLLVEICFLLLVPFHALLFWRLKADAEGFSFQSLRQTLSYRWADLLDLVEAPGGGFFLHTSKRSLYVSRHWSHYADILTQVKHHLYQRGWVPSLQQYGGSRWARPVVD